MINQFGKTLLFVFFIMLIVLGTQMALKVSIPFIRPVSASLADAISSK